MWEDIGPECFVIDDNPSTLVPPEVAVLFWGGGVENPEEMMTDWAGQAEFLNWPPLPLEVAEEAFALAKEKGGARIRFIPPGVTL